MVFAIRERDRAEDDPDSLPDVAAGRVRNSGAAKTRGLRRTLMMVAQDQAQQTRIPSKNWLSIVGGTRIDLPGRSQPVSQLGLFHQDTPVRPPISVSQIGVVDYGCRSLERFYPKVSAPSAFSAITLEQIGSIPRFVH